MPPINKMLAFTGTRPEPTFPLLALPVELVENVYKSLDSFDTAVKLACTSSFMHSIFAHQKPVIYLAILPCDPLFNGASRFASFADQAIAVYEAQRKVTAQEEEKRKLALLAARLPEPAGDESDMDEDEGEMDEMDEDEDEDDTAAAFPATKKAVRKSVESDEEENKYSLASAGFPGIEAVVKIAKVVNRCAALVGARLAPGPSIGFDEADITLYQQYAEEIIRGVLYDLWHLLVTRQKLTLRYYKGHQLPARHHTNNVLTADVVIYLTTLDLERVGFPAHNLVQATLPSLNYRVLSSYDTEPRLLLLSACRERADLIRDVEMMLEQQRLAYSDGGNSKAVEPKDEEDMSDIGEKDDTIKALHERLDRLAEKYAVHDTEAAAMKKELAALRETLKKIESA